ncbi:MAG TPA: bifunctional oligoribonuclease/PAP phosphatase NrnA [Opitutus sp.]|nr:bifunctional oligoribonuclease/PAP phosphatase NrnA [Opitutus sp.]
MDKFYPELSARLPGFLERIRGRKIAVIGHARPDGDCIGSQVAVSRVLQSRGHEVVCVNSDAVPRRLQFLVNGLRFIRTDEALRDPTDYAAIFVDCADHARPGERLKARFPSPVANIDHHLSNVGYAETNLVDSASAATCEILAGLFFDNGLAVDPQAAQGLYTGILTDTGQFRFTSTTQRTFRLAAELMRCGAKPTEAGFQLYERETLGKLHLLRHFLSSLSMECQARVCIGVLPNGIFEATGSTAEDTEGLVDYARCIDGVDVGVLIEERPDGSVKASLRAKDPAYRLDRVAARFNGGGHACAAGLSLKQDTEIFRQRLVSALAEQIAAVDAKNGSPV